jgi:hypothetical protein
VLDSVEDVTNTLAEIEKRSAEEAAASAGAEVDADVEDDIEDIDPDDLDLEALAGLKIDEDNDDEGGFDDGYGHLDDDDDEGEEWKKGS